MRTKKNRISSRLTAHKKRSQNAQPQNEILCSKGLGGAALNKQSGEENHGEILHSAGLCVLTQALLAHMCA